MLILTPQLTLYYAVAPTAAGRWDLSWILMSWSSGIPKLDRIKGALQISRATSSVCKRSSSYLTSLSINLVFQTATRGQYDHLFFFFFFFFFLNLRFSLIRHTNLTVSNDKSRGNLAEHGKRLRLSIKTTYLIYSDFHSFKKYL